MKSFVRKCFAYFTDLFSIDLLAYQPEGKVS